jgi:hypothetical protein
MEILNFHRYFTLQAWQKLQPCLRRFLSTGHRRKMNLTSYRPFSSSDAPSPPPDCGVYPGGNVLPYISTLEVVKPEKVNGVHEQRYLSSPLLGSLPSFSKNMFPEQNIPKFTNATSLYINVFCENFPQYPKWPVYRVMDPDGGLRPGAVDPELDEETVQKMYATMVRLQAMDQIFYNAQRQGRISFYMTNSGEVS